MRFLFIKKTELLVSKCSRIFAIRIERIPVKKENRLSCIKLCGLPPILQLFYYTQNIVQNNVQCMIYNAFYRKKLSFVCGNKRREKKRIIRKNKSKRMNKSCCSGKEVLQFVHQMNSIMNPFSQTRMIILAGDDGSCQPICLEVRKGYSELKVRKIAPC